MEKNGELSENSPVYTQCSRKLCRCACRAPKTASEEPKKEPPSTDSWKNEIKAEFKAPEA